MDRLQALIFGGPVLGLVSLGLYVPWASATPALASAAASLLLLLWVALGGNISRSDNSQGFKFVKILFVTLGLHWLIFSKVSQIFS